MHLLYENIPGYMFDHWSGNFYTNGEGFDDEYVLQKNIWSLIGNQMEESKKQCQQLLVDHLEIF